MSSLTCTLHYVRVLHLLDASIVNLSGMQSIKLSQNLSSGDSSVPIIIIQLKASHGEAGDEPAREGGGEEDKEGAREGERESSQPKPPSSPYHAPEVANKIKVYIQYSS